MTEIQRLEADIARSQEKVERLSKQLREAEKKSDETAIKNAQKRLDKEYELLDVAKDRLSAENSIQKSVNSQLTTFTRLTKGVKEKLAGDAKSATFIKEQLAAVGKLKAEQQLQVEANGESNDILDTRLDYFQDLTSEIISQAKQNETLEEKLKGQTDFEREKLEVASTYSSLREELNREIQKELNEEGKVLSIAQIKAGFGGKELKQKALMVDALNEEEQRVQELLNLKEKQVLSGQRLEAIEQNRADLSEMIPESMKGAVDFATKLKDQLKAGGAQLVAFTLLVGVLGAVVSTFTQLDEAAKGFREETGLTVSQTEELDKSVNSIVGNFSELGVDAEKVFGVASALKSEFSDISSFSEQTLSALTVLGTNFGVSADSAAKTQAILENIGGLTSETAASVQLQVANMANLAGVAPAKIIEDIAENAEIASTFFKGDINALAKAAVEARRLGTNIARTAEIAEGLLDFESSITKELEASAILGTSINFNKARALAIDGDTLGATKEILNQVRSIGDFQSMNYFEQKALADASGMTVEEITKQLNIQNKLNSLSSEQRALADKAIAQGLDISNINKDQLASQVEQFSKQQEMQGQVEKLNNAFMGIAATIGSSLTPLLEGLMPILQFLLLPVQAIATGFAMIVDFARENIPLMVTLGTLAGIYYAKTIAGAVAEIWGKIVGFLGPFGIPVAIAASMGAISMAKNAMSTADDFMSIPNGYGKRMLTTPEGTFAINDNDTIIGGTEIDKVQSSNTMSGTEIDKIQNGNTIDNAQNNSLISNNLPDLAAPMNMMIQELKALRNDMNTGKVAVYLDGKKVTSQISRIVDKSSKNSYAI